MQDGNPMTYKAAKAWFEKKAPIDQKQIMVCQLTKYTFACGDPDTPSKEIDKLHRDAAIGICELLTEMDLRMNSYADFIKFCAYLVVEASAMTGLSTLGTYLNDEPDDQGEEERCP